MPLGGNGDVDRPRASREELPELGRTLVAQHRPWAACLHCRKPASMPADGSMANRTHTAVDGMEVARVDAAVDACAGETAGKQLSYRENAVIARRGLGDAEIGVS